MRVSGFSFIRNGVRLGYPFVESIRSVLPLVDEFVLAVGPSDDGTMDILRHIEKTDGAGKLRLIESQWNTSAPSAFVYAAQSMLALYNCTGDWALYIQGDEAIHEDDHAPLLASLKAAQDDPRVEGLVFDYLHFFGTPSMMATSPAWYRREVRVVRNKGLKVVMPSDAQYFAVIEGRRRLRYLKCKPANARMFHYGWCRPEEEHAKKLTETAAYYQAAPTARPYANVDSKAVRAFTGTHPSVMHAWVERASKNVFLPDPKYRLSTREKRQRVKMFVEQALGVDWSKRHFTMV